MGTSLSGGNHTPGWAPPERENGVTGPTTDVYSLGQLLWHMLTNERPGVISEEARLSKMEEMGHPEWLGELINYSTVPHSADERIQSIAEFRIRPENQATCPDVRAVKWTNREWKYSLLLACLALLYAVRGKLTRTSSLAAIFGVRVAVLCDGMGGEASGEVSSKLVAGGFVKGIGSLYTNRSEEWAESEWRHKAYRKLVEKCHDSVNRVAGGPGFSGTTLTAVVLTFEGKSFIFRYSLISET